MTAMFVLYKFPIRKKVGYLQPASEALMVLLFTQGVETSVDGFLPASLTSVSNILARRRRRGR
jgi:hypothetical protein